MRTSGLHSASASCEARAQAGNRRAKDPLDDLGGRAMVHGGQRTISTAHQHTGPARQAGGAVARALHVTPRDQGPGSRDPDDIGAILLEDPAIGGAALQVIDNVDRPWLAV